MSIDITTLETPGVRRLASNWLCSMKRWEASDEAVRATGQRYLELLRTLPWNPETAKTFYTNGSLSLAEFEQLVELALRS